jgi:hypothetical protein
MVFTDYKKFELWSSSEVASYLQTKESISNYGSLFESHKIDGSIAHRLTDENLKSIGVTAIGDRHRILAALEEFKKEKQQTDRERILWSGREVLYWSTVDGCWKTCCGLFREDREEYTLRFNYLDIKRPDYNRCFGSFKCCFGHKYHIETIDLW